MRRSRALLALLIVTLAGASGCTAGAWRDRAHDFAQIFEVTGSLGPGLPDNPFGFVTLPPQVLVAAGVVGPVGLVIAIDLAC